jgi:lysyl-tRNA synthetase class 2
VSEDLRRGRLEKLERLRECGHKPYPERFPRTHSISEVRSLEAALRQSVALEAEKASAEGRQPAHVLGPRVAAAGRLVLWRHMGKLTFATIQDVADRVQVSIERDALSSDPEASRDQYSLLQKTIDLGDFIGVEGPLYLTRKGELTIQVESWTFLGKALRPLPGKWAGLQNQEVAWRRRYLDLIANPESRERFRARSVITRTIRSFLDEHGFEEVETPILCNKASGALARPFIAHHNSLDLDVFLRIAPETYLKRLIVAGYDRVYEFARCFRNEGMDPSHLQDFTMLEFYASYWNYEDNMDFTERMIKEVVSRVKGSLKFRCGEQELDFSGQWPRRSIAELILEHTGIAIAEHPSAESLLAAMDARKISLERRDVGRGNLIDQLYKKTVRPKLIQPLFLIKHPTDLSPLARSNDEDPNIVDRFQLVVNTWEVVNAYSELVDPIEQRKRLEDQAAQNAAGDDEAMEMDEDYLLAMEYGMPPISGWGMGIDRFTALLTNAPNLRDTIFFPLMRPSEGPISDEAEESSS